MVLPLLLFTEGLVQLTGDFQVPRDRKIKVHQEQSEASTKHIADLILIHIIFKQESYLHSSMEPCI